MVNKTLSGLAHGLSQVVSASDSNSYIYPTVSVVIWDGFSFGPGFNLLFEIAQMKTDSFGPSGHDKVLVLILKRHRQVAKAKQTASEPTKPFVFKSGEE
jgi:hypothetical protein